MCRQQQEKPADFYSNIHSNFFLNQVCTIWLKKNHIAIIPMVLRLQYDPWFPSHRKKKIICWGQCQLNMFMLQDDNRQNFPINKLPVPLRLFVKSLWEQKTGTKLTYYNVQLVSLMWSEQTKLQVWNNPYWSGLEIPEWRRRRWGTADGPGPPHCGCTCDHKEHGFIHSSFTGCTTESLKATRNKKL